MSFESLGTFYLGRELNAAGDADTTKPLLYDSRDLTTHAVCVGMTGSGKTGLCLSLLEEAAIDGIPTIAIDPKGDLGNLLLTFPALRAEDFAPWIDAGEAARKGMSTQAFSEQTAETWRKGLAEWDQDGARIQRFRDAANVLIYTPGSDSGRPLSVLQSFSAPPAAARADAGALRDRVASTVSGLLGLAGIDADPLQSREHILLSTILGEAWTQGRDLELGTLIQNVQKPSFDKVGVFDLETFYPAKERLRLAMALNTLIAAPGFATWMHGEPLDIQRLLYGDDGKPRICVLSIAHLNDAERMFIVTLVLGEIVAWMRRQPGTSSLRALVYMDEIFGYFPPSAMPPAKLPLLTLMKQARAFGVGVVLATQNPVDLDYKGLSNAGTWFIGRLQTERDKARVIDGLLTAGEDGISKAELEKLIANLGNRVFLMRNVHDDAPVLFRTRWALSYLRGPLTLQEIAKLTPAAPARKEESHVTSSAKSSRSSMQSRPIVASNVQEYFWRTASQAPIYAAHLLGIVRMHFVDKKSGIDAWETRSYVVKTGPAGNIDWSLASVLGDIQSQLDNAPAASARFGELPATLQRAQSYESWKKQLAGHVQQSATLKVLSCPAVGQSMAPGSSESEFRAKIALALREKRDEAVEQLRRKYGPRLASLQDQLRRADDRIQREKSQLTDRKMQTAVSVGTSLLGALLGRKRISVTNASRVGSAARSAGRIGREQEDVQRAEEGRETIEQRRADLEQELQQEIARLQTEMDPSAVPITEIAISPRKTDTEVIELALLWRE
jgi:hypothetical protein